MAALEGEAGAVAGSRGDMRPTATVGAVGQASAIYASRWRCSACQAMNVPTKAKCGRCRSSKPADAETVVVQAPATASDWTEAYDHNSQQIYYYNNQTKVSQWTRPKELGPAPHATGWFGRGASGSEAAMRYIQQNIAWLKRPARKQSEVDMKRPGYNEGQQTYNIWYGRYDGADANQRLLPGEPAPTRCCLSQDAGWTLADKDTTERRPFCLFFARGSCGYGTECQFHHHLPGPIEERHLEATRDIFGRMRHAEHRDDMSGAGCYTSDSRTLYVGNLRADTAATPQLSNGGGPVPTRGGPKLAPQDATVEMLYRHFGEWGEIENINFIERKNIAFIRYRMRVNAEFAREAMDHQALDGKEVINCKWAFDDPNPVAIAASQRANEDAFLMAMKARGYEMVHSAREGAVGAGVTGAEGISDAASAGAAAGGGLIGDGQEGVDGAAVPGQGGGAAAAGGEEQPLEDLSQNAFFRAVTDSIGECPTQDTDAPEYAAWYKKYSDTAAAMWPQWEAKQAAAGSGSADAASGTKRSREEGEGALDADAGAAPSAAKKAATEE